MALSAWVKPSSDPMAILVIVLPSSVAKSSTRPDLKKKNIIRKRELKKYTVNPSQPQTYNKLR